MEYHLPIMSAKLWESIKKGYIDPQYSPTTSNEIKAYESNAKAIVAIVSCLNDANFSKVTCTKSAKETWEMLKSVFEGYIHLVNEILNALRGVGGTLEESEVVKKIMAKLPKSYKPKKYAIEESHDMNKHTVNQLLGSLSIFDIVELDDIKKERKEAQHSRCMYKQDCGGRPNDDDKGKENYKGNNRDIRRDDREKQKKNFCSTKVYSFEEDGNDSNEESLFFSIQEKNDGWFKRLEDVKNNEKPVSVKTTLHAKVEPKVWIIDSGCSNHMTGDRNKFINLEKYDGGLVKFGEEEYTPICGKGSISIDGNFLVAQVCNQIEDVPVTKAIPTIVIELNALEDKSWAIIVEQETNLIEESQTLEPIPNSLDKNVAKDKRRFMKKLNKAGREKDKDKVNNSN
ncbi:uncharacterized protein LOC131057584 [Cryptomeria japonica]|uniref:uncharacterized protein LOC131057584 n=1 Tax=Cryptomeria japonica TaxID=3369 RepID=UPI0025AC1FAB|nr:uncharacterized protein LOC131057584 [Cryptomeria japonica]